MSNLAPDERVRAEKDIDEVEAKLLQQAEEKEIEIISPREFFLLLQERSFFY
jgi:hypothetical protein